MFGLISSLLKGAGDSMKQNDQQAADKELKTINRTAPGVNDLTSPDENAVNMNDFGDLAGNDPRLTMKKKKPLMMVT